MRTVISKNTGHHLFSIQRVARSFNIFSKVTLCVKSLPIPAVEPTIFWILSKSFFFDIKNATIGQIHVPSHFALYSLFDFVAYLSSYYEKAIIAI